MKKLIMEFLGTFFLVLTVVMTGNAFAIAAMLMAWVYIGGSISGAHYNPAVSLAMVLRNRLSWHTFGYYVIAQIAGGTAAYLLAAFIKKAITLPTPGATITLMQAGILEVLLTFVLVYVILTVATGAALRGNQIFGFAIGFTIPALAAVGGPISGGLFNPAIALSSHIFGFFYGIPFHWSTLVMYVGGALLGGALAAYAFDYFSNEYGEQVH